MHDLAVLVPSRGRPDNLKRLIDSVRATAELETHVIAAVDDDDPRLQDYLNLELTGEDRIVNGPRRNLVQWTNDMFLGTEGDYRFYASLGDDMVPRTKGWDAKLCGAIEREYGGTGITYPWDGVRDDIPEAYVLSADIPAALGWIMQPGLTHWYNDNVIADLGHGAGCIRQLRGVIVDHLNVGLGKAPVDQTAIDSGQRIQQDQEAYQAWCRDLEGGRMADVLKVRGLRLVPSR